jgi:hypothetical protein
VTDVTAATDATTGVTTDAVSGTTDAVIGSNDSVAATGDAATGVTTDAVTGATDGVIGSTDGLAATGDAATGVTDAASATTDAVATSLEGTAMATTDALPSVYDAGAAADAATTAATGAVSGLADAGMSSTDAAAAGATGGIESLANATSEANSVISTPEVVTTAAPDVLTSLGDGSAPGDTVAAVTDPVTNLADAAASSTGGAISATTTLADSAAGVSGGVASSPADVLPGVVDTAVSGASTASLAGATDTTPLADAVTGVGASAFDATASPDLVMPAGDSTTAAAEVAVNGTNPVTVLTGVTDAATPQLATMNGPVPSANGVGAGGPGVPEPVSGIAGDFLASAADVPRLDLVALTDALATPEARLGLLTAIGILGVSRAYGVSVIGTVQPLMEACTASIRMTFQSVRLVPCTAGATASGLGSVGSVGGTPDAARRSRPFGVLGEVARASQDQVARATDLPGLAVERLRPWAAHGSSLLLRLVTFILATLSAALAAVGAVRHERNRPRARRYS